MAERLHPGVYVEERRRGLAPIQGVSTSTYGTVGFTTRGPTDTPVLVTSFESFERTFGGFTEKSQVPTHLFAFFAEGGTRAYVVRVVASDATSADGFITSNWTEDAATGDGTEKDYTDGGAGPLSASHTPIEPGSASILYRTDGSEVSDEVVTTDQSVDGSNQNFTFVLANSDRIVVGSVTITATISASPETFTDSSQQGELRDSGGETRGYIDYETGRVTISFSTAPDTGTDITAEYTPADQEVTLSDDGSGNITGSTLTGSGTIDYETGDIEFTIDSGSDAPSNGSAIELSYTQQVWDIDPISKGAWGNDVTVRVRGNEDSFSRDTAEYSLYDVLVLLDGAVEEVFSGLSFTDPTLSSYVGTRINDQDQGSNYVSLAEPSNEDVAPFTLNGVQKNHSVGGGNGSADSFGSTDGSDGTPDIPDGIRSAPLSTPIQQGSVSITYTDVSGETRTITDDGNGNLIGDVDSGAAAGLNVIDYDTGDFTFKVPAGQEPSAAETSHSTPPTGNVPGSLISASYYVRPSNEEVDAALSGGTDGTAGITRNELTDPAIKSDRRGMYALLTTDELLNVAIPDAAGDVTMAVDQVTEAQSNGKWFIILATPPGLTPQEARSYRRNELGINSSYGALYYPYIRISDPVTDSGLNIPPAGHIAGVYARTDSQKSVGKAPAGTVDGRLNFAVGLERNLEFTEIDILHPSQINAIIDTPQTGRAVWGVRTLENPPGDFRYIHVRRLFNFLKASIFNSTHGFVFENVGAALRSRIRLTVESFLRNLFNQGLFAGQTPSEAFNVICDETNNPLSVEQAGEVICDVFIAPNTPGEFIVFRLQQKFASTG